MHLLCLRPESSLRFYYDWGESNKSWKCPVKHQVLKRWAHHRCQQVWATFCCAFFNTLFNVSWKDPYIPHHESIVQALKWHVVHTHTHTFTKSKLLFFKKKKKKICVLLCATVHLAFCRESFQHEGDVELEKVRVEGRRRKRRRCWREGWFCIQQTTVGMWSMKEAPPPKKEKKTAAARHPDKTLQIVPLIKSLSCRNTIDSKRLKLVHPPSHRSPLPILHPPCYIHRLALSVSFIFCPFSISSVPKLHPKTMHTTHQARDGRRLWSGWGG